LVAVLSSHDTLTEDLIGAERKSYTMSPLISRLLPTAYCDSENGRSGIMTSVRSAVSVPESEVRRWRRTFDSNATIEIEEQKLVLL
jgi:hypothetical protein